MHIAGRAEFQLLSSVYLSMLWVAVVTVLKGRAASFVDYIHVDDLLFPFYLRHACIDIIVLGTNQNAILRFWKV